MKIELNRDWSGFLSALIARRVKFVLVGGHAASLANARRLRDALIDFGFGVVAPSVEELAAADKIFMLGRKPWRIDVLTGIDGVTFAEAWASRVEADFVVKPLFVIGRNAHQEQGRCCTSEGPLGRRRALTDGRARGEEAEENEAPLVAQALVEALTSLQHAARASRWR